MLARFLLPRAACSTCRPEAFEQLWPSLTQLGPMSANAGTLRRNIDHVGQHPPDSQAPSLCQTSACHPLCARELGHVWTTSANFCRTLPAFYQRSSNFAARIQRPVRCRPSLPRFRRKFFAPPAKRSENTLSVLREKFVWHRYCAEFGARPGSIERNRICPRPRKPPSSPTLELAARSILRIRALSVKIVASFQLEPASVGSGTSRSPAALPQLRKARGKGTPDCVAF